MIRLKTSRKPLMPARAHTVHGRSALRALCLAVQWGALAAHAETFDAHSGLNTNWSTPTNWVGNAAPTSGSLNVEVVLGSNGSSGLLTSNQDLAAPFVLQRLSIGPVASFTSHAVIGAPLAFSNLGGAPSITTLDFLAPPLTVNSDIILNADLTVSPPGTIPTIAEYSINGAISGPGALRLNNGGRLFLGGTMANTYAGFTVLDEGELYLNKPDSVLSIPGDLVINTGGTPRSLRGTVIVGNDNQIATGAAVTINRGVLSIQGGDQTLAKVTFTGADSPVPAWDGGNIVIGSTRTLTITGGITRTSTIASFPDLNTSLISGGTLNLGGALRPFHVDNVIPPGSTPATLTVSSVITNGGIEKTGAGVLHLSEAKNTFTGNVVVNGGLFSIGQNAELMFDLDNGGMSNRILGTATTLLDGKFNIDATTVTDAFGTWNLVDAASLNETFGASFGLQFVSGPAFANLGGGVYKSGRWTFTTADGNLSLSVVPEATGAVLIFLALTMGGLCKRNLVIAGGPGCRPRLPGWRSH